MIRTRINRVRLGNLGDCKSVGEGVNELRIKFGTGYRIYFGQEGDTIIILLSGGDKSSHEERVYAANYAPLSCVLRRTARMRHRHAYA